MLAGHDVLIVNPDGYFFNSQSVCPVKRVIQKKVLNELSKQMLLGKIKPKDESLSRFFGMVMDLLSIVL